MVKINEMQITKVAKLIKELPEAGHGLNFYSFNVGDKEIIIASQTCIRRSITRRPQFFSFLS